MDGGVYQQGDGGPLSVLDVQEVGNSESNDS